MKIEAVVQNLNIPREKMEENGNIEKMRKNYSEMPQMENGRRLNIQCNSGDPTLYFNFEFLISFFI